MQFILEASADRHHKNLPTSNKVAVIIPDKYSDACFHNIVLAEHCTSNKQLQYCCINSMHAVYIPLHYVLLFLCGDTGWH